MASSNRLKTTERSHLHVHTSLSYAHYKLSAEYSQKRRICVQTRSAGCILSGTKHADSRKYLQKQGIPVLSTSLQSEHCPSGIYSSGAQSGSLPPSSRHIGNPINNDDWLIHHLDWPSSFTLPAVSVTKDPGLGRPQVERSKIRAGPSSGYPVSLTWIMGELHSQYPRPGR